MDAKLGYSNRDDKDGDWKLYASSVEKRNLDCVSEEVNNSLLCYSKKFTNKICYIIEIGRY